MQLQKTKNKVLLSWAAILVFAINACNITTNTEKQHSDSVSAITISPTHKPDTSTSTVLDNASIISCDKVGMIAIGDSYSDVEQKVGKGNITLDSNYTEGEFTGTYNTLWKNSPKEMKIYWDETSVSNKKVGSIEIENEKSIYQFSNGVKIGSTLDQLIKMNDNKPLRFYGFDWDYGGMIINDGNGIGSYKCFSGTLNYSANSIDKKFLGDREMNSSMPGIPLKKIYLSSIQISKPDK